MSRKIRIGKDIALRWAILTNGEMASLDGRDLKLVLTTPNNKKEILDFEVNTNVVISKYLGVQQKILGVYTLTLWENFGKEGQTAVDICHAFELVSSTCKEDNNTDDIINETVDLETAKIDVIPKYGIYSTKVKFIEVVNEEVENPREDTLYIII